MKNMIDSVAEEKAPFSAKAFCEIDSLVLSHEAFYRHTGDSVRNRKLLAALAGSPRFYNININYHVNKLDYAKEKQFSAITFELRSYRLHRFSQDRLYLCRMERGLQYGFFQPDPFAGGKRQVI